MNDERKPTDEPGDQPLTLLEMLQSVLAAAFGVQSNKNRSRDFSRGKPSHFILLGLLFTGLFVLALIALVYLALALSGAS